MKTYSRNLLGLLLGLCVLACSESDDPPARGTPGSGGNGAGTGGAGAGTGATGGSTSGTGATGGAGDFDGGIDDGCSSVEKSAEVQRGAVDIIWAIDDSGSMDDEIAAVQMNINTFANQISGAGVDHHVVMITDSDVAAGTPLGGDPTHYLYRPLSIGSNDAFRKLLDDYDNYSSFLRPGAPTHFVVVTDDESDLASADFRTQMEAKLGHGFFFHSIVSEDTGGGLACVGACGIPFVCGAAAPGYEYILLTDATGGQKISICTADWSQVFGPLQEAVIGSVPLPCSYTIPPPPSGEVLDPNRVNVEYTDGNDVRDTFPRADSDAQCGALDAWYYDDPLDPTEIKLCPATCEAVEGGGTLKIVFGCATVPLQ